MTEEWRFNVVQELLQYSTLLNQRKDMFCCSINTGLFCTSVILRALYQIIHTFSANDFQLMPALITNILLLTRTSIETFITLATPLLMLPHATFHDN